MRLQTICLLPLLSLLACCTPAKAPTPRYEYELVSVEQQALEAIAAMPTEFRVPFEDDEAVWDRSHLFFKSYTNGGFEQEFDYPSPGTMLRSKPGGGERYRYEIEKILSNGGYRYVIQCVARDPAAHLCDRNARNVARFIRDGHLELSLLDR